jgi:hypothetical protein
MKLISVLYNSYAVMAFSEADLAELLTLCRENNTLMGITGLLLFKDGKFLQVLEGEERAVQELLSKIERDPRHSQMVESRWETLKERSFSDWSMGFRNLNNIDIHAPGYSMFMNEPLPSAGFRADPSRVQKLLQVFRD